MNNMTIKMTIDSRNECNGAIKVGLMRASNFTSNESLDFQHIGIVYHQGRIPSINTSESHGGRERET